MPKTDPLAAIRERDARAECVELPCHPGAHDRRLLLQIIDGLNDGYGQEINRLREENVACREVVTDQHGQITYLRGVAFGEGEVG